MGKQRAYSRVFNTAAGYASKFDDEDEGGQDDEEVQT
jgi:hypothetical protein